MKPLRVVAMLLFGAALNWPALTRAGIVSFYGFENAGDTAVWQGGTITRVPSGGGTLSVPSASGSYHAEVVNAHDDYMTGYGTAGYTFYGLPRNQGYLGDFFQSIDVYIDKS